MACQYRQYPPMVMITKWLSTSRTGPAIALQSTQRSLGTRAVESGLATSHLVRKNQAPVLHISKRGDDYPIRPWCHND